MAGADVSTVQNVLNGQVDINAFGTTSNLDAITKG